MKTKVIADLSSNHLGNKEVIEASIKLLAEAGVNIVKTQSWNRDTLVKEFPNYDKVYDFYGKVGLTDEDHYTIKGWCDTYGVEMLCTCFDIGRADFLGSLGLRSVKLASPDLTSHSMILKLSEKFEHLIISTASSTGDEINETIDLCNSKGINATFLHCNPEYPTPLDNVNLKCMLNLKDKDVSFGYSDHTVGTEASKLAIAWGADYIEKHFTLSRDIPGSDNFMSTTHEEFAELVSWAELVMKMRGDGEFWQNDITSEYRSKFIGRWGNNR